MPWRPDGGKQKGRQVGVRRSPMTNCSLLLLLDVTLPRSTAHNQKMIELADSLTKSQRFVAIHEIMTICAPNFRLQFLDSDSAIVLVDRPLSAADADDAAREAAFGDWPAGGRLCRVASLDRREVASVGRVLPPGRPPINPAVYLPFFDRASGR